MKEELNELSTAQLRTIELIHSITIANAHEGAGWIAVTGRNKQDVSDVCTVLNTWIAIKGVHVAEISETVVRDFTRKVQDRSR